MVAGDGVDVRAPRRWQRLLQPSQSYLSSNDLRVHFGLGQAVKIPSLCVRWPNGSVQRLKDVKADQILTVQQPR